MTTDLMDRACELGCKSKDLRFTAHELFHMLSCDAKTANTDAIHRAVTKKHKRADMWLEEMRARACEWLVCEHFGEAYDAKQWALISQMESINYRLPYSENAIELITKMRDDDAVKAAAARIIAADF